MKAICRINKIKTQGSALGKSQHNYREKEVSNADPRLQYLNEEYINHEQKDLWQACSDRIQEAGIKRAVRADAVRGIEFILTASPEFFPKDHRGQNLDARNSSWLNANLGFMQERYGKNLVAFTLHQDEKTPHIHAIVVPITSDNKLSAKQLFNPKTLRQLQTDYALCMKRFGLERGVEYSTAIHQDMRKLYGAEKQALQQVNTPIEIQKPKLLDLLNLDKWQERQEEKANELLTEAQKQALENIKLKNEVESLKKRLETSEKLKQSNFEDLSKAKRTINDLYLSAALGVTEEMKQKGNQIRQQIFKDFRKHFADASISIYGNLNDLGTSMQTLVASNPNYSLRRNERQEIVGLNLKQSNVHLSMESISSVYENIKSVYLSEQSQSKEQKRDRGLNFGLGY